MADFDVVAVADLRVGSPVVGDVVDALAGWAAAGCRTALVQISQAPLDTLAPFAAGIRAYVDRGQASLALPHERVKTSTVAIWHPEVLAHRFIPVIETQSVVVVSGRKGVGADEVRRLFGIDPVWGCSARAIARGLDDAPPQPETEPTERSVLMVSSNGTGMGHLTRLLAYARKAPADVRPHFLSLSQAAPVVSDFGFPYEYVPSAAPTGMAPARWRSYLARRLGEAIERLSPETVVFDGAWAYEAINDVRKEFSDVSWVWSRRGMWYRGMNREQLAKAAWFDVVLEPGDFASPADPGATAGEPADRVGPVTLLDHGELLSRADARAALDLDPNAPTALVTLGAGNINDASSEVRIVIDALRALGMEICVTVPAIADRAGTDDMHVRLVATYPLARYLRAFDVAVSAAGYNSFHELLRFGVPTLFLPNLQTSLDDQQTRAQFAAARGWAYCLEKPAPATVASALESLLHDGIEMVAKVAEIDPGNGAGQAMDVVAGHVGRVA